MSKTQPFKTAIGRMYARRLANAPSETVGQLAREAQLELGDLLDHSGPRALRNRAAHDMRELRRLVEAGQ